MKKFTKENKTLTPKNWTVETDSDIIALSDKMEATFKADNYNNPFKVGEIMPCCGEKYCFSYDSMKYMPRNPKLKYRETASEGDVDQDPYSRDPEFVQYNNCREAIRQAMEKGHNHVHWRLSVASSEAIQRDGFIDHNDKLNTISWKPGIVKSFKNECKKEIDRYNQDGCMVTILAVVTYLLF